MSFIQSCGERGKKSARGRRRSRDEKGNQGVRDFRFINILQLFSIYFFFELLYFITFFFQTFFFTHEIYPHPHPRPTTSTHYPRPTTFSYTPEFVALQGWQKSNDTFDPKFFKASVRSFEEGIVEVCYRWLNLQMPTLFAVGPH